MLDEDLLSVDQNSGSPLRPNILDESDTDMPEQPLSHNTAANHSSSNTATSTTDTPLHHPSWTHRG